LSAPFRFIGHGSYAANERNEVTVCPAMPMRAGLAAHATTSTAHASVYKARRTAPAQHWPSPKLCRSIVAASRAQDGDIAITLSPGATRAFEQSGCKTVKSDAP